MRLAPLLLIALVTFACQSSHNAPPTSVDAIDSAKVDALVASAMTAPDPTTQAAAAFAATDVRTASLASALSAIDRAFAVCTTNIANADTTAYKAVVAGTDPGGRPFFHTNFEQGSLENTGRQLDVAISGQGFFKIKGLDSQGDGYGYTRCGNLFVNRTGELVLGLADAYKLEPRVTVPKNAADVSISSDGNIEVVLPGSGTKRRIGQIEIYQFLSPENLGLLGGTVYLETEASGRPVQSHPGENGAGQVIQGFLEHSNVQPDKEYVRMRFLQNWRNAILRAIDVAK